MQNNDTRDDVRLEEAKGRLANAVVHLETVVKERIEKADKEKDALPHNMVSSKLVQRLQEEVAMLKQDKGELQEQLRVLEEKYEKLKSASENAVDTMDVIIEDLIAYREGRG